MIVIFEPCLIEGLSHNRNIEMLVAQASPLLKAKSMFALSSWLVGAGTHPLQQINHHNHKQLLVAASSL